jgi:thymidylate kinase
VRSTLVLFDRYYHDILVDPKRYRYGGPSWLAHLIGEFIPKPDIWVLLDAPPEILLERKQEITLAEAARQREEYLKLINNLDNGFVIDATQGLDNVVADVNSIILDFMAQRADKRHA